MDETSARRSKWLVLNAVYLRLEAGRAFYEAGPEVVGPEADTLFARQRLVWLAYLGALVLAT